MSLRATITDAKGKVIGSGKLEGFDEHWKKYETTIRTEPPTSTRT